MLFRGDGEGVVRSHRLQHVEMNHIQLEAARGPLVGADFASNNHGGFLREVSGRLKNFRRYGIFGDYTLNQARAIAEDGEQKLARGAQVVKPAKQRHFLTIKLGNLFDADRRLKRAWRLRTAHQTFS